MMKFAFCLLCFCSAREINLVRVQNTESLIYALEDALEDTKINLKLQKSGFLASDYKQLIYENGMLKEIPGNFVDCHFTGFVEGEENTTVALSTCDGLMEGFILTKNDFARIHTENGKTFLSPTDDVKWMNEILTTKVSKPKRRLGGGGDGGDPPSGFVKSREASREAYAVDVIVINDKAAYENRGDANELYTLQVMNNVAAYYEASNFFPKIKILLKSQITWKTDPIHPKPDREGKVDVLEMLVKFENWLAANKATFPNFDVVQIHSGREFQGTTVGIASLKGLCNGQYASSIISRYLQSAAQDAMISAHEIGHILGIDHDSTRNCRRDFIMQAKYTTALETLFSSCSIAAFADFVLEGGTSCLKPI